MGDTGDERGAEGVQSGVQIVGILPREIADALAGLGIHADGAGIIRVIRLEVQDHRLPQAQAAHHRLIVLRPGHRTAHQVAGFEGNLARRGFEVGDPGLHLRRGRAEALGPAQGFAPVGDPTQAGGQIAPGRQGPGLRRLLTNTSH